MTEKSNNLNADAKSSREINAGSKDIERPHLTMERSLTRNETDLSEDGYLFGDTSGDSPFAVEHLGYSADPSMVNIHQFFPVFEPNFDRAISGRLGDKQLQLKTISEDESSVRARGDSPSLSMKDDDGQTTGIEMSESNRNGRIGVLAGTGAGAALALDDGAGELGGGEGANFSRIPGITQGTGMETNKDDGQLIQSDNTLEGDSQPTSGSVFATSVDEETIQAAKKRRHITFKGDEWSMVKTTTYSLKDIIAKRASEHYQRALQLSSEERWTESITALNKAINLKSDEAAFYQQRGEAFLHLCDFQSAILNYKKACLLDSSDGSLYHRLSFLFYFQGQCLFDQQLYNEALESFSRAAEMDPDNIGYHIRSMTCLAALQRHGECLALVNRRLEYDSNNPDLYVMRARLHEMFGNTTLCFYDVKDALTIDPDHAEARIIMTGLEQRAAETKLQAMHLNINGKHREALQKISVAIETNPSVADYHVLRGALHRKLNDFNSAIDDFLLALDKCDHNEENPVYSNAQRQLLLTYNDFAVECFKKGFYDEAIILLNKAIKGEKNEKGLYINRGDCFFKQGEHTFALQDYQQAMELESFDPAIASRIAVIHNEFGVNLFQDRKYIEAEIQFTLALQYCPRVGQYYVSRSRARYILENVSGARQDLLCGLLLDPTNEDILSIMARLFPGKSVADVLSSPAANAAHALLENITPLEEVLAIPSSYFNATDTEIETVVPYNSETQSDVKSEWNPGSCLPTLALCLEEKEFNLTLVNEKRKIELDIKDALQNRRSLHKPMTKIQPLPPVSSLPRYGSQLPGRAPDVVPAIKRNKRSTNWRTFSLGIGLQNT